MFVTIITCIGLVCSALSAAFAIRSARQHEQRIPKTAFVWGAVFMLLQAFIAVWSGIGLVQDDPISAAAFTLVTTACAAASFNRVAVRERLLKFVEAEGRFPHPLAASVILMLLASAFAVLGLEVPSNYNITWMYPLCLLLEFGLVAAVLTGAYFIFQRRGGVPAALALVLHLIGIAEYFVITFKSMPISPGDLTALSTAAAVAGTGYTYTLSAFCLYGMAFAALSMMLSQLAACCAPRVRRAAAAAWSSTCWWASRSSAAWRRTSRSSTTITRSISRSTPGARLRATTVRASCRRSSRARRPSSRRVPTTTASTTPRNCWTSTPRPYDETAGATEDRTAAAAQFDEEKPTVIAVMNETFSDLSIYQQMHADYTGPKFFKSLRNCLSRGKLYVSAYGGGTANTEFEFLTGNSMANLGSGVYPYTIYDLMETENLAQQFKDLGYDTTAMHPNHATNWNRENVYQDFGFDQFLAIEDFEGADTLRGMVTDQATYDKILEMLRRTRTRSSSSM